MSLSRLFRAEEFDGKIILYIWVSISFDSSDLLEFFLRVQQSETLEFLLDGASEREKRSEDDEELEL